MFFDDPADAPEIYRSEHTSAPAIKLAVSYWACILYCRRWLTPAEPRAEVHDVAVRTITRCLREQYAQKKHGILSLIWTVFMAAIDTTDSVDRDWLLGRLEEFRHASTECQWSWRVAMEITEAESLPGSAQVNLSSYRELGTVKLV